MKRITILGSTGSIGKSTLGVIRNFPGKFKIAGLSTNSNIDLLHQQIKEFHPDFVCVNEESAALKLKPKLKSSLKLFVGGEGLEQIIQDKQADTIVMAISGSSALRPLLKAIDNGNKYIALANKEALVMAGDIIMDRAKKKKISIIPIDSEQSAIWQCLDGQDSLKVRNIYLTASGGPLGHKSKKCLEHISIDEVLRHPKWKMGKKISVDSATLMNKGLEVLETMFLFNIGLDKIKILIHPEAIIHSMVEFIDGVILAQLSIPDMRIPIQYALTYPQRFSNRLPGVDFLSLKRLNFQRPDFRRFPCLRLALRAAGERGTMPAVLNAVNEVSVEKFLNSKLDFSCIPKVIEKILNRHKNKVKPKLEDIIEADVWARREACRFINN